jgi:hypothetical protein
VRTWHFLLALARGDGTSTTDGGPYLEVPALEITAMTMTPNSSKILSLLRKSPRSSDTTPMPAKTPPSDLDSILAELAPGDVLSFQRFHWQSMKTDTKLGALETSIAVLSEAANLASNIPYLAAVASMIVHIIKIRYVCTVLLLFLRSTFS